MICTADKDNVDNVSVNKKKSNKTTSPGKRWTNHKLYCWTLYCRLNVSKNGFCTHPGMFFLFNFFIEVRWTTGDGAQGSRWYGAGRTAKRWSFPMLLCKKKGLGYTTLNTNFNWFIRDCGTDHD